MMKPIELFDAMKARVRNRRRNEAEDPLEEIAGREFDGSSERARRDLGWQTRPLEDTVADTIAWIKRTFLAAHA
jgi:nucleoside-diphosphate-sugar epimerase